MKSAWKIGLKAEDFTRTSNLFLRLLGLVYFCAFASLTREVIGLYGADGIVPISAFLNQVLLRHGGSSYFLVPSLFWINSSDAALLLGCMVGSLLSLPLLLGRSRGWTLVLLYLLYLSFVSAGTDFLSFQWDNLLLEAGFISIWIPVTRSKTGAPSPYVLLLLWILLAKLMLSSGLVKILSGDSTWRDLTALQFHFETQPLPTVLGWFAYQLPGIVLRAFCLGMFLIELICPFLIFAPKRARIAAALLFFGLQISIGLTGNYCFFNLLTCALALMLMDDQYLFGAKAADCSPVSTRHTLVGSVAVLLYLTLSVTQFLGTGGLFQAANRELAPFRIVNSYGLFAVMTKERLEIELEGSDDGIEWKSYAFKYKPSDPKLAPSWIQPFQPRLDWQMWFAALGPLEQSPWFLNLAVGVLEGKRPIVALLRTNPFPNRPKYLRAITYRYTFTDPSRWLETGAWWNRERTGIYMPAIALASRAK